MTTLAIVVAIASLYIGICVGYAAACFASAAADQSS